MTFYARKLQRIKADCFSNEEQLGIALRLKRYLDVHYAREIDLATLARRQYVSKFHLLRIFKHYLGTTPRQYLINQRITQAKRLLSAGKSVSETCFAVGFSSVSSFSALFKARTGMPPSRYGKATFDKPED